VEEPLLIAFDRAEGLVGVDGVLECVEGGGEWDCNLLYCFQNEGGESMDIDERVKKNA